MQRGVRGDRLSEEVQERENRAVQQDPSCQNQGMDADLAVELAPMLRESCEGKLGEIQWFRSPWQRGGAATGYSTWTHSGKTTDVVVKLPVGYTEFFWTTKLSAPGGSTPAVIASGEHLGAYDLAWLVIERVQGKTLGHDIEEQRVLSLLSAACDVHARARAIKYPTDADRPSAPNWDRLIGRAREAVRDNHVPHEHRWSEGLKRVHKSLDHLVSEWQLREIDTWCHGDLHPGNAIVETDGAGRLVLIDLALVHAGHWVEDAVYLERQYWGHADFLHGVKPVSALARLRRERGLSTGDEYARIADVRRLLMAACVPAMLGREGGPAYVDAALTILERLCPVLLR